MKRRRRVVIAVQLDEEAPEDPQKAGGAATNIQNTVLAQQNQTKCNPGVMVSASTCMEAGIYAITNDTINEKGSNSSSSVLSTARTGRKFYNSRHSVAFSTAATESNTACMNDVASDTTLRPILNSDQLQVSGSNKTYDNASMFVSEQFRDDDEFSARSVMKCTSLCGKYVSLGGKRQRHREFIGKNRLSLRSRPSMPNGKEAIGAIDKRLTSSCSENCTANEPITSEIKLRHKQTRAKASDTSMAVLNTKQARRNKDQTREIIRDFVQRKKHISRVNTIARARISRRGPFLLV